MRIRNKRTGIEGDYPERTAKWLIAGGRCEEVKPEKKVRAAKPEKTSESGEPPKKSQTYQTRDLKADVALSQKDAQ